MTGRFIALGMSAAMLLLWSRTSVASTNVNGLALTYGAKLTRQLQLEYLTFWIPTFELWKIGVEAESGQVRDLPGQTRLSGIYGGLEKAFVCASNQNVSVALLAGRADVENTRREASVITEERETYRSYEARIGWSYQFFSRSDKKAHFAIGGGLLGKSWQPSTNGHSDGELPDEIRNGGVYLAVDGSLNALW
jgi:hypothetical protein